MTTQHVTPLTYLDAILEADKPVLVEFWSPTCHACIDVAKIVDELTTELCGMVGVVKVNIDEVPAATKTFCIDNVPRLLVLDRGQVVGDFSGVILKQDVMSAVRPLVR